MQFADTYQRTDVFRCTVCDLGTGPTEEVDADDDGTPYPPPGWARVTIEQVERNPDWDEAMALRQAQLEAQLQAAIAQAEKPPGDAEIASVREFLDAQMALPDVPEFVVVPCVVALCQQHVGKVVELGVEILPALVGLEEPPQVDLAAPSVEGP